MMPDSMAQARPARTRPPTSPKALLKMYENWVSENSNSVSQIESALRSLTYIIPGRFKEAELASESLHSFIQLLSLYHTNLLHSLYAHLPSSIPRPPPTLHNRYTHFWSNQSKLYTRIARILQTIQYTELLWEMLARRRGQKTRWRVVIILESVKAFCRLILMRVTNSRPGINPPLPERERDPRSLAAESEAAAGQEHTGQQWDGMDIEDPENDQQHEREPDSKPWSMPRTGLTLPTLPETGDITEYLMKRVLTPDDIKAPKQLLHKLTSLQAQVAEIMWILRPVVYAVLLARYQQATTPTGTGLARGTARSKSSWTPWLVGVGIEVAARQLATGDMSARFAGGLRGATGLEKEEYKARGWNMAWWGLRGAFYENVTKSWIRGVAGKFKGRMLLDMVGTVIEDYDYLWDEYYFSTATM